MQNQRYNMYKSGSARRIRRSNKKRNVYITIGAVVVLVLLALYITFFTSSDGTRKYTFYSVQERQTVAQNAVNKLKGMTSPPSMSAYSKPLTSVVLSEKEANAILQGYIDSNPSIRAAMIKYGVQNPTAQLGNDAVKVSARVSYSGITVPVTMDVIALPAGMSTMKLVVTDAKIGHMPVASQLKEKLTSFLDKAAPGGQFKLPGNISSVRVQEGKLIVTK